MAFDLREQLQRSLGEAYRIERELGGGGMSRVFLAVETALRRQVVVKVLLPELAAGVSVDRFRREIQLAARLQHPHIVPLLSAGDAGGLPWFTMPFVDGESLRARLVRDGELPVAEAVRVLRDVASALSYAHAQGVAHRDIKPDNVLLAHGVAVVTDFGVAKALTMSAGPDSTPRPGGLTSLGIALGTPAYMSPEQASADPGMDHRVDIYSFGATAYEVLTGQPVFGGRTPQAMLGAHITAIPEPITNRRPGIPPLLALVVMKCLEKRPADRPQTATEIVSALDMLTTPSGGTVPIAPVRVGRLARWRMAARANFRRLAPALGALVVGGAVAFLAWLGRESAEGPPPSVPVAEEPAPVAAAPVPVPPPAGEDTTDTADPPPAPATPAPAPVRPREAPRPPRTPPVAAEETALLRRLRSEAATARERAVRAGAAESILARGDSDLARADSLASAGQVAAAAAQISRAGTRWSDAAAEADRARTADAAAVPEPPEPEPPAAVPAPAPVPPPAPSPPADPRPQIYALFEQYGAAIEARSVEAIRRTYPGLQPQQARDWEGFFTNVSDVQVELKVVELEVSGDSATAQLAGVYVFTNPSTHRTQRENVSFEAQLRRANGRWRIASLR